jgi:YbbR domain-containing protein
MIDLQIATTGEPAAGYVVTNVDYEPKTIEIAGEDDVLEAINALPIAESIDGASETIEKEINIQEQLGEGLIVAGEDQTVVLNITIEKTETKELTIWPGDIEIKNLDAAYNLAYLTTGPILLEIVGPKKEIAELTKKSLKPYIDLTNYSGGTYAMSIGVELLVHTKVVNNPTVSVFLTK